MVRFYSDGVFKAFWRDVLARDPVLTETKIFAEKHLEECQKIEKIAETRYGGDKGEGRHAGKRVRGGQRGYSG